jgi:hypothetical protein
MICGESEEYLWVTSLVAVAADAGPSQHMCGLCSSHRAPKFWGPKISVHAYIHVLLEKKFAEPIDIYPGLSLR